MKNDTTAASSVHGFSDGDTDSDTDDGEDNERDEEANPAFAPCSARVRSELKIAALLTACT